MLPPERQPFPIAEVAEDYLRRRLLASLERVERELRRYDAWETNGLLPAEVQGAVRRPRLPREGLDALQRLLTEELARPDGPRLGA